MKKILFLVSILIPSIVFAGPHVRNESQSTLYSAEGGTQPTSAVDRYGNQMCTMAAGTASATNPIKLEGSTAANSDAAMTTLGRVNMSGTTLASDGQYTTFGLDTLGAQYITYNHSLQGVPAQALTKAEDAASASGDAGVAMLAVRNTHNNSLTSADGDYSGVSVNSYGAVMADISYNQVSSAAQSILKQEDSAVANLDVGVAVFGINQSTMSATSAVGDYGWLKLDEVGRLITTLAPAGEMWQGCSSVSTTTANTAIKAAVASNRIYVTSLSCTNTSAVASEITIKDGTGNIYTGAVGTQAATGGNWQTTFPVPLRGTVNTALNFAMTTTATATTCCGSGYISVN